MNIHITKMYYIIICDEFSRIVLGTRVMHNINAQR